MKKIIALLLLILCSPVLSAAGEQRLKVVVKDTEGYLAYAYLEINSHTVTYTDSLGVGWISYDLLSVGDTISASYIGTPSVSTVYTEQIRESGLCELFYDSPLFGGVVDEVVVTGSAEKFLAKSLKNSYVVSVNGILEADFEAELTTEDSLKKTIKGTLRVENLVRDKSFERFAQFGRFHVLKEIQTSDDTTKLAGKLDRLVRDAMGSFAQGPFSSSARVLHRKNYNNQYGYLGKENDIKKFRVTHTSKQDNSFIYQSLLYVDPATRTLLRTEVSLLISGLLDNIKATVVIDYSEYIYRRNHRMLIPQTIDYTSEVSGEVRHIRITNTRFRAY